MASGRAGAAAAGAKSAAGVRREVGAEGSRHKAAEVEAISPRVAAAEETTRGAEGGGEEVVVAEVVAAAVGTVGPAGLTLLPRRGPLRTVVVPGESRQGGAVRTARHPSPPNCKSFFLVTATYALVKIYESPFWICL